MWWVLGRIWLPRVEKKGQGKAYLVSADARMSNKNVSWCVLEFIFTWFMLEFTSNFLMDRAVHFFCWISCTQLHRSQIVESEVGNTPSAIVVFVTPGKHEGKGV